MTQRWTPDEEEILFRLVYDSWLIIKAVPGRRLSADTPVIIDIHKKFSRSFGNQRDPLSLLGKLSNFRHGGSSGVKFGNYNPNNGTLTINKLSLNSSPRDFDWGPQHLYRPLREDLVQTALNIFESLIDSGEFNVQKTIKQTIEAIKQNHPKLRKIPTPLQVVRLLLIHDKLIIDNHGQYALPPCGGTIRSAHQRFSQQIEQHKLSDVIHQAINKQRAILGRHFSVHQYKKAAISFSSEGTGSGKSYQVNETYSNYLSEFADQLEANSIAIPGRNFCNQLFLAPQKNQLDIASHQVQRIERVGGELICVLSQQDIPNLDILNWFTAESNENRYKRWIKVGKKKNPYIGGALSALERAINLVKHNEQEEKRLRSNLIPENAVQLELVERMLEMNRHEISNAITQAACDLVSGHEDEHGDETIWYLIQKGREARKKRLFDDKKYRTHEIYLEILGQVIPFNVCAEVPCLMLMTTQKFE